MEKSIELFRGGARKHPSRPISIYLIRNGWLVVYSVTKYFLYARKNITVARNQSILSEVFFSNFPKRKKSNHTFFQKFLNVELLPFR